MILNDNSTQQINTLVIQLQNKITNLTNEFRKLNNNINDLNSEISDLEKRVSSNENDADNNIDGLDSKISDLEKRVSSNENDAAAMNAEISANTEAINGKADKIHTHTKSEITDFPTSLPANGGTADSANNGFNSSTTTDSTPGWGYLTSANGYSNGRTYGFANGGGIATAEKDTKSSLQVDGDLYVHEGLDKVATLNDIPTSLPANGGTADTATSVNLSKTLDTVNGDKLQIGSGTAQNVTNAKHAATADAFSTTYTSYITPAQAAAMKSESTIWPLSYSKDYLQTVTVTWDDYSSHTFPAGAAGMFFPGYGSNGGTLILVIYGSSRMLYNVWIDSNRWSGWHYIDLPAISYT